MSTRVNPGSHCFQSQRDKAHLNLYHILFLMQSHPLLPPHTTFQPSPRTLSNQLLESQNLRSESRQKKSQAKLLSEAVGRVYQERHLCSDIATADGGSVTG